MMITPLSKRCFEFSTQSVDAIVDVLHAPIQARQAVDQRGVRAAVVIAGTTYELVDLAPALAPTGIAMGDAPGLAA